MIFSYVEVLIPVNFGIPGVKIGLANIVILIGLYVIKIREVLMISVIRIILSGVLFGNIMSIAYSMAGGMLSLVVMAIMKRCKGFSMNGVSIAGGVVHNIGQLIVAMLVIKNFRLVVYLPVLLIAGAVTGFLIGILSSGIVPAVEREMEKHTF